jgi:hypothetical protein
MNKMNKMCENKKYEEIKRMMEKEEIKREDF